MLLQKFSALLRFRTIRVFLPSSLWIENLGQHLTRYSLALVLLWMGLLKFTAFEAAAIQPIINSHYLLAWLYSVFSVQATSNLIGTIEVLAGTLLALRAWSPLTALILIA